jgi:hypothetical protein
MAAETRQGGERGERALLPGVIPRSCDRSRLLGDAAGLRKTRYLGAMAAKRATKKTPASKTKKKASPRKAKPKKTALAKATKPKATKPKATKRKATKPSAKKSERARFVRRPETVTPPIGLEEARARIAVRLGELRPRLEAELRDRIFVFPAPAKAKSLDFEIFESALGGAKGSPAIAGYFMDGEGGQVFFPDPYLEVHVTREPLLDDEIGARFLEAEQAVWRLRDELVLQWFVEAWAAANGKTAYPLSASVCFHDGDPTPLPTARSRALTNPSEKPRD